LNEPTTGTLKELLAEINYEYKPATGMEIELENFDGALNMAVRRQRVHLGWRSAGHE